MSTKVTEEQTNGIKFTEDELNEVKFIQQKYQEKILLLGQISLDRFAVEDKLNYLNEVEKKVRDEFVTVQNLENDFLKKVTDKYGEGSLDTKTGTFHAKKTS